MRCEENTFFNSANFVSCFIFAKFCWVSIFPTVYEGNTLSQHRRTSQVSAGRLHSGANGGDIARRHGGQRQEESQPAVWPQHPGELQVRAPAQEACGGGTELPPPRPPPGGCEAARLCRAEGCWCWLRGAAAADLAQLCGLKSRCVVESLCFVFGRVCSRRTETACVLPPNHTFLNIMSHTFFFVVATTSCNNCIATVRVPACGLIYGISFLLI